MTKIGKKLAAIILALAMIVTVMPVLSAQDVYADEVVTIDTPDGLHFSNNYTIAGFGCDDGEVYLTGYDGEVTDLVIPSTVTY